ncbi:MAG TPA: hypothetical protein VK968_08160, partial [Roseimicrobium sp.]|nr:hypothetical protein [Roseimicrobium sp.]
MTDLNNVSNDVDGDGATNDEEAAEGTDPFNYDTDYDGLNDGDELHLVKPSLGVSLTNWDSDSDYVSDYDEWCNFNGVTYPGGQLPTYPGASYSDYDGDGYKNPVDAYPTDPYNGSNTDSDGDGIMDAYDPYPGDSANYSSQNDIAWYGDVLGDMDSDGTLNWQDVYPYPSIGDDDNDGFDNNTDPFPLDSTNYSSTNSVAWYADVFGDADSDGTMNYVDATPYPPPADDDGDGIPNSTDPYPSDATNYSGVNSIAWNTEVLADADGDGTPNWEDTSPYGQTADNDLDDDGLDDPVDPFPNDATNYSYTNSTAWYNDVLGDADSDGTPNHADSYPYDPYNGGSPPDSDNDSIPDSSDPYPNDPWNNQDADGDGLTDLQEVGYGSTSGFGTNPSDVDTDHDHLTDYEEIYVYSTNPLLEKTNPSQLYVDFYHVPSGDADSDGLPDNVEDWYTIIGHTLDKNNPVDAQGDLDGDGITNLQAYQVGWSLVANMVSYDMDGDGMTDVQEDYWSAVHLATVPAGLLDKSDPSDGVEDPDQDGVMNFEEIALRMDP